MKAAWARLICDWSGINVIWAQEHQYFHLVAKLKYRYVRKGWVFISALVWKTSTAITIGDVSMLLNSRAHKVIRNIEEIEPGFIRASFNRN